MTEFSSGSRTDKGAAQRLRSVLGACGLLVMLSAAGQTWADGNWNWLDEHGRKVYSDMPPPATVPEHRILQRPGSVSLPVATPAAAPSPSGSQPSPATSDSAQADAASKPPAERPLYQRNADTLRENCRRARAALQTLNSELRLRTINEQGEAVVLDDAMRAQEIRRMQQEERDNCVPERKGGKR